MYDCLGSGLSRLLCRRLQRYRPSAQASPRVRRLSFEASDLADWDSALLTFLLKLKELCDQRQIVFDQAGLPHGVQRLVALATAVPEHQEARREEKRASLLVWLGQSALDLVEATARTSDFPRPGGAGIWAVHTGPGQISRGRSVAHHASKVARRRCRLCRSSVFSWA